MSDVSADPTRDDPTPTRTCEGHDATAEPASEARASSLRRGCAWVPGRGMAARLALGRSPTGAAMREEPVPPAEAR